MSILMHAVMLSLLWGMAWGGGAMPIQIVSIIVLLPIAVPLVTTCSEKQGLLFDVEERRLATCFTATLRALFVVAWAIVHIAGPGLYLVSTDLWVNSGGMAFSLYSENMIKFRFEYQATHDQQKSNRYMWNGHSFHSAGGVFDVNEYFTRDRRMPYGCQFEPGSSRVAVKIAEWLSEGLNVTTRIKSIPQEPFGLFPSSNTSLVYRCSVWTCSPTCRTSDVQDCDASEFD